MENYQAFYKYGNLPTGTRIFFKGDEKDYACYGTVLIELSDEFLITMDNGKLFRVHPLHFEAFGGLFQVEEERMAKVSYLQLN